HCVCFTEKLDDDEVRQLGPRIETHAAFPNRTNVQFARVLARDRLEIRIWERGAGWTLASGSSSCAVAAAAVRNDLAGGRLTIQSPGGELGVEVRDDWSIRLQGRVAEACEGALAPELVHALRVGAPLPFE